MTDHIQLRAVLQDDLPLFFGHQLDAEANHMAAFTAPDPHDRAAFTARWANILAQDAIIKQTILYQAQVVGHVLQFVQYGQPEISYWIGKAFWGRGIATQALHLFLQHIPTRPLYARAAQDNRASLRVLSKCGFVIVGEDTGFAHARNTIVAEYILIQHQ